MKRQSAALRKLKEDLHYHQERVRIDLKSARLGMEKVKEIAAKMRDLQNAR